MSSPPGSTIVLSDSPESPKEEEDYSVSFGRKFGACKDTGCNCPKFQPVGDADGGPCETCTHFPGQHQDLGPADSDSSDDEEVETSPKEPVQLGKIKFPAEILYEESPGDGAFLESLGNIDFELKDPEITFGEKLGSGTSAQVYKGTLGGLVVAIKVIKSIVDQKQARNIMMELSIMNSIRSENLVKFYGVVLRPRVAIVMEYCSRGTLYHVLNAKNLTDFGWANCFKLSIGASRGIQLLHEWDPPVVHRDLKSLNLLINENWDVKVSDFGLSRFLDEGNQSTLTRMRGTFAYAAPELYFEEAYTTWSDIYSLGVILWELVVRIITGFYERPFADHRQIVFDFQIYVQVARKGLRPTLPPTIPPPFKFLIERCWHSDPGKRPAAADVAEVLEKFSQDYNQDPKKWDNCIVKTTTESISPEDQPGRPEKGLEMEGEYRSPLFRRADNIGGGKKKKKSKDPVLHTYIRRGDYDAVKKNINTSTVSEVDEFKQTPLHSAVAENQYKIAKLLLDEGASHFLNLRDKEGWTPLHCCASVGNLRMVELLLQYKDLNVKLPTKDGTTALHYLVRKGVFDDDLSTYLGILRSLIEQGSDVNAQTKTGNSPLHYCALRGNLGALKLLLEYHADPNIANSTGESPLHCALSVPTVNYNCVEKLLEAGAKPYLESRKGGLTPMKIALEKHPSIVSLLKEERFSSNATKEKRKKKPEKPAPKEPEKSTTPQTSVPLVPALQLAPDPKETLFRIAESGTLEELQTFLANKNNLQFLNSIDPKGWYPLLSACNSDNSNKLQIIKLLLENGAIATNVTPTQASALHLLAKMRPQKQPVDEQLLTEVIKTLVSKGVSVNQLNSTKFTPLHEAAVRDCTMVARVLITLGADIEPLGTPKLITPLTAAIMQDNAAMVQLLISSGATKIDPKFETPLQMAESLKKKKVQQVLAPEIYSGTSDTTPPVGSPTSSPTADEV